MTATVRVRQLGGARWIELWDGRRWPGYLVDGMPAFRFRQAPAGLSTRRQLRAADLAPGRGNEPWALLVWKSGRRWAWLYRDDLAVIKRVPSPKQLTAVRLRALAARQICIVCGPVGYCVRTTDRLCGACFVAGAATSSAPACVSTAVDGGAAAEVPAWELVRQLGPVSEGCAA